MDATMQMASTATKMGRSAASKTTSMTTNLASKTADLTTKGLSKTANLTTRGLSKTANLTTRATAGAVNVSMGAVGVSKDATVMLFTSIAEQIPGYEGEKTSECSRQPSIHDSSSIISHFPLSIHVGLTTSVF